MIIDELKRIYDENLHKYQDEYNKIIAELKIAASNGRKYITIDKVSPAVETMLKKDFEVKPMSYPDLTITHTIK